MTLRSALFIGLIGLAAACGSPPAATSASPAPSSASNTATPAAPAPNRIQTGEWRTVMTYTNVTGLPPALAHGMMSRPHSVDGCSNDGDINAAVHDAINGGGDMTCTENSLTAANGAISGTASCHDADGDAGNMRISGSYSATHVDVNGDLSAHTQMGPVSEHIHWVSDHNADACTGSNG